MDIALKSLHMCCIKHEFIQNFFISKNPTLIFVFKIIMHYYDFNVVG